MRMVRCVEEEESLSVMHHPTIRGVVFVQDGRISAVQADRITRLSTSSTSEA